MVRDGWHMVYGMRVYVENNIVLRATKYDYNRSIVPAAVYWRCRSGGWNNVNGMVTLAEFRAGARRGTAMVA